MIFARTLANENLPHFFKTLVLSLLNSEKEATKNVEYGPQKRYVTKPKPKRDDDLGHKL